MAGSLKLRFWTIPQTRMETHHLGFEILLMGVSGHGKSATGNAIVGRKAFESKGGFSSVTKELYVAHTTLRGRMIKVVDIPGFADTDEGSDEKKYQLVARALTKALCKFPNGFHAVLLVMSYTSRGTEEMKKNVCDMYKTFNKEAFRTHGILVVTSGDAFERDHEDDGMTLKSWLEKDFPEILGICGGRCLLFNNVTKDPDEKYHQNMKLLETIISIDNKSPHNAIAFMYQDHDKKSFEEDRLRASHMDYISTSLGLIHDSICKNGIDKERGTREIADTKRRVESLESPALQQHLYEAIDKLDDLVKRNEETQATKNEAEEIITRAQLVLDREDSWWKAVWRCVSNEVLPAIGSYLWSWWTGC